MSFNLDEFLTNLEGNATEKVAEEVKVEGQTPAIEATQEEEKVAALVEEGQIMARSFMEEIEKVAVGDAPITPNTGAVKSPEDINRVENTEIKKEEVGKVQAILSQLVAAQTAGVGEIAVGAQVADHPARPMPDEKPLPADMAKAQEKQVAMAEETKVAAANILENLYNTFFTEGE